MQSERSLELMSPDRLIQQAMSPSSRVRHLEKINDERGLRKAILLAQDGRLVEKATKQKPKANFIRDAKRATKQLNASVAVKHELFTINPT